MPKISEEQGREMMIVQGVGWGVLTGESNHVLGDGDGSSPGSRPCPRAISSISS